MEILLGIIFFVILFFIQYHNDDTLDSFDKTGTFY